MLLEEETKHRYHIPIHFVNYNRDIPARYTGVIVSQMVWE